MKINVTKQNILNGKARNCEICPIALAVSDNEFVMRNSKINTINIDGEYITLMVSGGGFEHILYKLPLKAKKFIEDFDKSKIKDRTKFKPFSFTARLIN